LSIFEYLVTKTKFLLVQTTSAADTGFCRQNLSPSLHACANDVLSVCHCVRKHVCLCYVTVCLQLSPMTVPRRRAVLVGTSTSLVVVGGQTNTEDLRSAEHYDFATNEWALIAQLPNTLCAHAGCVYSDHSSIYISGGCRATQFTEYPGHIPTNDVHFYDLDIGAWQRRASMTQVHQAMLITLSILDVFLTLFHHHMLSKICDKILLKAPLHQKPITTLRCETQML